MARFIILLILSLPLLASAQKEDYPTDFLDKNFHSKKREEFRAMMPDNSVAVFFSNPKRNRANDVEYVYHQDPDFYYLTGYREPGSLLIIFNEKQKSQNGTFDEIIFSQSNNNRRPTYDGLILGVAGVQALGFNKVFDAATFKEMEVDFSKFDKVMIFDFKKRCPR